MNGPSSRTSSRTPKGGGDVLPEASRHAARAAAGARPGLGSGAKQRGRLPSPRLTLRIADCVHEVNLEFSVDSPELRENSLYKVQTLIAALERFRAGLRAEAELRALRERA